MTTGTSVTAPTAKGVISAPTSVVNTPAPATARSTITSASPLVKRAVAHLSAISAAAAQRGEVNRAIITAPPRAAVGKNIAISSASTQYVVPVLPKNTADNVRKAYALRLAASLRNDKPLNDRQVVVVLLALFHILYEDTTDRSQGKEWTIRVLSAKEITELTGFVAAIRNYPDPADPQFAAKENALLQRFSIAEIPGVGEISSFFTGGPLDWIMFHGYAGLLLFAMHKDASGSGVDSLRTTRPLALRNKYKKSEDDYPLWSDEGVPSIYGFVACTAAWKIIPMTREELMRSFARISTSPSLADQEALFLAVRLMAWTDLAHIPLITLAINSFPLLQHCPALRGGFAAYNAGIVQMIEAMPYLCDESGSFVRDANNQLVRDVTTLPFVKAMFGDKKSFAQRNTMELLICVAKKMLLPSIKSLNKYTEPAGYGGAVADIVDWHDDLVARVQEAETN